MWRLIIIAVTLVLMAVVNIWTMGMFMYKYKPYLGEMITRKVICLIIEQTYFLYMVITFIKIDEPEEVICWFKKLSYFSFSFIMLNEILSLLIDMKLSIGDSKTSIYLDPSLRIYFRLWDRLYLEIFMLSSMATIMLVCYQIYDYVHEYYQEKRKRQYIEAHFKKIQYKGEMEQTNCSICLNEYEMDQQIMSCPCSHNFHNECLMSWLKNKTNCPVCRKQFFEEQAVQQH